MRFSELLCEAALRGVSLSALAVSIESSETGRTTEEIRLKAEGLLYVMVESIKEGLEKTENVSKSWLSGGDAHLVNGGCGLPGNQLVSKAVAYSLAVSELNADMGRIVAAPTAGACGTIPGTFFALAETMDIGFSITRGLTGAPVSLLTDAIITSGLIGQVIADKVGISGAVAGCQAESGSAAAMAAAGICSMMGGTPEDCIHGATLALKGLMGLVCDPVCGLVEVPCIKRNATSAAVAIASSEMALAGVRSRIPPDEVLWAMAQVGRSMPMELRETSLGGLASTPSALKLKETLS